MADDSLRRIEERLARIEKRLSELEERASIAPPAAVPMPPPIPTGVTFEPPPSYVPPPRPQQDWRVPPPPQVPYATNRPQFAPKPPKSQQEKDDAEYKIGAQILPRIGAVVFLIGVIYLVGLAISRHLITPQMQWYGELALCAGFIVVGLIKRNEREDFGQLLVGIGSCGLYFSFAGAQAYKHLISGNTLVLLFIVLSLSNLLFSWWRASRSFWVIGILGGLIGALMPLKEHNLLMNGSLQLSIVAVAALVSARHKWFAFTVLLYASAIGAACAALFPVYGDEWKQLSFLYSDAIICLAAIAYARHDIEFDPPNLLLPILSFAVGVLAFCVRDGLKGSLHSAIFAVALGILAALFPASSVSRNRLLVSAAGVALLLVPAGDVHNCIYIYGSLSLVAGMLSWYKPRRLIIAFCWADLLFGCGAYFTADVFHFSWQKELASCLLYVAAAAVAALSGPRQEGFQKESKQFATIFATFIGTCFILRAGYLAGIRIDPAHRDFVTQIVTSLILAASAAVLSLRSNFKAANVYAGIMSVYSLVMYISGMTSDPTLLSRGEELVIIGLFAGLMWLLYRAAQGAEKKPLDVSLALFVWACLFLRAGDLVGTLIDPLHRETMTQVYSGLIVAAASVQVLRMTRSKALIVISWAFAAYALGAYMTALSPDTFLPPGTIPFKHTSVNEELAILAAFMLFVLFSIRTDLRFGPRDATLSLGSLILFGFAWRFGYLLFTSPAIGMKDTAAMTLSWIVYGAILIAAGFIKRAQALRFMALILFGCTLAKVFLFDLSNLDPGVRVAILMCLGIVMIGGGYWYIRLRKGSLPGAV